MELTATKNRTRKMDNSGLKMDSLIAWRREKVWEYRSMGCSIDEIVQVMRGHNKDVRISHGTVHRDLQGKQEEIEKNFKTYIEKDLPLQHNLAVTGLDRVVKEAWRIYAKTADDKTRLAALATIADATMKKQQVLGDPAQIDRAIKVVNKLREQMEMDQGDSKEGVEQ